jgi:thiol:disulfide interchange protein
MMYPTAHASPGTKSRAGNNLDVLSELMYVAAAILAVGGVIVGFAVGTHSVGLGIALAVGAFVEALLFACVGAIANGVWRLGLPAADKHPAPAQSTSD